MSKIMSKSLSIDSLLISDIPQLAALAEQVWLDTFSAGLTETDIEDALSSRNQSYFESACLSQTILVAKSGAELCGFIEYGPRESNEVSIDKLYVASAYQGQSIGRRLMKHSFDDPKVVDKNVILDVWIENIKARALYESMGFKVTGERAFISSSGKELTPDLIMQRTSSQIDAPI
ncbi:MAG: ribosomal protein S18 acetylase RimI-like enzyme [Patiriisocius sp.]|jgi:ribosomal protein S18 acetylase RimI-like enzyme